MPLPVGVLRGRLTRGVPLQPRQPPLRAKVALYWLGLAPLVVVLEGEVVVVVVAQAALFHRPLLPWPTLTSLPITLTPWIRAL